MDMTDVRELRNYSFPTGGIFLVSIGFLMLAAVIYAFIIGAAKLLALVIIVLCSAFMIIVGGFDFIVYARLIERIKKNGEMPVLTADFKRGRRVLGGDLILGEMWAIGRHTGYMIKYSDIVYARQNIIKNKGAEASRNITVLNRNEKAPRVLCNLKTGGRSDNELSQIMVFLREKMSQYNHYEENF